MNEKRPTRRKRPHSEIEPSAPASPALLVPPEKMDFDRRLRRLPTSFGSRYGQCFLGFIDLFNARVTIRLNPEVVQCEEPLHAYLDFARRDLDIPWQATCFRPPDLWVRWGETDDDELTYDPVAVRCLKAVATATCQHLGFHPSLPLDVLDIVCQRGIHECHYRLQELARSQAILKAARTPTPYP